MCHCEQLSAEISIAAVTMLGLTLPHPLNFHSLSILRMGTEAQPFFIFLGILGTDLRHLIPGRKIARSRNKSTANFIAIRLRHWNGLH